MPRLRNTTTGAVVNVPVEKAARLTGYEPADKPAPAPPPKKAAQDPK